MTESPDVFSLAGFQPLTAPRQHERLAARLDGTIDVIFYRDRPLDEALPEFRIYLGKEYGNQVDTDREFGNRHVTSLRNTLIGTKDYRFLLRACDVQILPGDYVLRFFANEQEVNIKYLSVQNSLVLAPTLPPRFQV